MTVAELIEVLRALPQDRRVVLVCPADAHPCEVTYADPSEMVDLGRGDFCSIIPGAMTAWEMERVASVVELR